MTSTCKVRTGAYDAAVPAGDNEHLAGERGDLRGREGLVGEDAGDVADDEHVAAVVRKDDSSSATFLRDALLGLGPCLAETAMSATSSPIFHPTWDSPSLLVSLDYTVDVP